jgi:mannitol/fructose-specific phosphotransferase system IIA component (Ntr-type)
MPVSRAKPFWKLFRVKACAVGLVADNKQDVLREVVANLVAAGSLEPDLAPVAERALLEREQLGSTGVGQNVAIPHVKVPGLVEAAASLSVHTAGIEWAAVDGDPVQILFTVLRPESSTQRHDPERHLEMMRWIASLSRSDDFRSFALQVRTRTDLVGLLREMA